MLTPFREPAGWCDAGTGASAEWAWELRSEIQRDWADEAHCLWRVGAAGTATVIWAQGI